MGRSSNYARWMFSEEVYSLSEKMSLEAAGCDNLAENFLAPACSTRCGLCALQHHLPAVGRVDTFVERTAAQARRRYSLYCHWPRLPV